MAPELLIIGLHRVGFAPPNAKIKGLFITPKLLESQLSFVRQMGFEFTTLQKAISNKSGKFAVITFDDGCADVLVNGLPVLQKFQAPATVFVITDDIGKRNVVWKEASEDLPADLLSWNDLETLLGEGWEIGSHSHEHVRHSGYTPPEQEDLIISSIEEIRHNLGIEPLSFAYPYGDFQCETKKILRGCGIKYAVTTRQTKSLKFDEQVDLLELPRVSLGGRNFRHYVKNLIRTTKAVGFGAAISGLGRIWKSKTSATLMRINSSALI